LVTLGRVLASVIQVSGDRISEVSGRPDGVRMTGLPRMKHRELVDQTTARWGTSAVWVAMPSNGSGGLQPRMVWRLLLERTGWKTVVDEFRPLGETFAPTVVTIPSDAVSMEMGAVRLSCRGRELPADWSGLCMVMEVRDENTDLQMGLKAPMGAGWSVPLQ
jgi:hypothetical protein